MPSALTVKLTCVSKKDKFFNMSIAVYTVPHVHPAVLDQPSLVIAYAYNSNNTSLQKRY